jgi:hypothetical protein
MLDSSYPVISQLNIVLLGISVLLPISPKIFPSPNLNNFVNSEILVYMANKYNYLCLRLTESCCLIYLLHYIFVALRF